MTKCRAAHYSAEQCDFFLFVSDGTDRKTADVIFNAAAGHAATQ